MRLATFVGVGAIVALAACKNGYGNGGGCSPTATQVCMVSKAFSPLNRTVIHGTTVQWVNGDSFDHTVTSDPGSGETYDQTVVGGGTFSFTFNTAGTYTYHCQIHGAPGTGMHGTITVNP